MLTLQVLAVVAGVVLIALILLDAFETIVLPRRPSGGLRLTVVLYRISWGATKRIALRTSGSRREGILSFYGPLWMISLVAVWAVVIILAFALIHWGLGSGIVASFIGGEPGFWMDVYMSGTTLFTLGMGDVAPRTLEARIVAVAEAGLGLGFLALVIGYLPVLYGAFARREVLISLFDARAGSPPAAGELIRRYAGTRPDDLVSTLEEFERWSAELLESHLSYPILAYYRSQHDRQSWLSGVTTALDVSAILLAAGEPRTRFQAQLTFAMARHAVIDLAQVLGTRPGPTEDRLADGVVSQLWAGVTAAGLAATDEATFAARLRELAASYEPHVVAIGRHLVLAPPPWVPETAEPDDWETDALAATGR